jgi:hypothetical protein
MTRILHLDDEPDRRNLMREALQDHCVSSLGRLEDALTALRDGSHFDLALVAMTSTSDPGTCPTGGELLEFLVACAWYPSIYRVVVTDWSLPPGETARMFDRYPVEEIIDCEGMDAQQLSRAVGNALAVKQRRIPQQTRIYRSELRHEIKTARRVTGAEIRDHIHGMEEYVTATSRIPGQRHRAEQEIERSRFVLRELEQAFERLAETVDQIATLQEATLLREDLRSTKTMFADERALWGAPYVSDTGCRVPPHTPNESWQDRLPLWLPTSQSSHVSRAAPSIR